MPETCDRLLIQAATALRAGQFAQAEQLARDSLQIDPSYTPAKLLLGSLFARLSKPEQAIDYLTQVLVANPTSYEALMSLAAVYRETHRPAEAIELNRRAVSLRPADPQAFNALGRSHLAARQLSDAANAFEQAIGLNPEFAAAHFNLGKTKQFQGRDGEAATCYRVAAELSPNLENQLAFGQIQLNLCDYQGAFECASQCLTRHPNSVAAHLLMCGALTELKRLPEAESHLTPGLELDTDGREALQLAARQRPFGYIEEANQSLRRAIDRDPRLVAAYDSLMQNQKATEADRPLLDNMRRLLAEGSLAPTEEAALHYGLGKGLEDIGEYEESFRHYDDANRITRLIKIGHAPFNETRYAAHVSGIIARFSDLSVKQPCESAVPILVIGMMRSGTTLVEQILSSHPEIGAAGEQLFWSQHWPEATEENAGTFGLQYAAYLQQFDPRAKRVTDKMPGNYLFAGLIHAALPNARIIHVRRSPIDTCLSIWTTPSHMPHDGGHDKAGIVFVYRQYLKAMEQWRRQLPAERFLEIDYENLVSDPEPTTRKMLELIGLDWNQACLNPEQNKRIVNTPSAWQVRQPVYKTSIQRWKKFEPFLGQFRDLL